MDEDGRSNSDREALSAAARAMAAARRVVGPIKCAECGREVVATTAGAPNRKRRYCSTACNQRAYWRRNADELKRRQRERYAERRRAQPPSEQPTDPPASSPPK
jgi:hypothetical protein